MTPLERVLIVDCETSSTDATTGHLLELGVVRWSVTHRTVLCCASWIVQAPSNGAESVNGIPPAALEHGVSRATVAEHVLVWAEPCQAIVAHNAEFDRAWLPDLGRPWICTMDDVQWPRPSTSRSLSAIALAHGVGVSHAHRALPDCLLIAQLLERVGELGVDVEGMLRRALRPRATYAAQVSYADRQQAKDAGFRWEPDRRLWMRRMACEDAASLPFAVNEVNP